MSMTVLADVLSAALAITAVLQAPIGLTFVDVTIRESGATANERGGAELLPSGDFSASRQTVRQLIARTYGVRESQVVDVPDALAALHFDVVAKAPAAASALDGPDMLRRLLADHFGLVVRNDRRKESAYALTRAGRGLGRRMRQASARCTPLPGRSTEATRQSASGANECTAALGWNGNTIFIRQSPMSALVGLLEAELRGTVVDRTGLTGKYDADVLSPGVALAGPSRQHGRPTIPCFKPSASSSI